MSIGRCAESQCVGLPSRLRIEMDLMSSEFPLLLDELQKMRHMLLAAFGVQMQLAGAVPFAEVCAVLRCQHIAAISHRQVYAPIMGECSVSPSPVSEESSGRCQSMLYHCNERAEFP